MDSRPFIDTNIFLRFLIADNTNPNLSNKAKQLFSALKKDKIKVQTNSLVVSELVYVLEKFYGLSKQEAAERLTPLLSLKNVYLREKKKILRALALHFEKNIDFVDAFIYLDMLGNEVFDIFTFDKHFNKFDDVNVLDIPGESEVILNG